MARRNQGGFSLKKMVSRQVARVLERGQRFGSFDQIRQRHFWSSYLFAVGEGTDPQNPAANGGVIQAGNYDLFKIIPSQLGQGYPLPLTLRETNWLNSGRVPDNQNFAITELGVTVRGIPSAAQVGDSPNRTLLNVPTNSIAASLPQTGPAGSNNMHLERPLHPEDTASVLYGMLLNMQFLTNSVPLGLCADFSQSGGVQSWESFPISLVPDAESFRPGDALNGVPAAAFRRKLEVPILLQHGEAMGMQLVVPKDITLLNDVQGGTGCLEVRVDWWATESFVEKS